MDINIRQTPKPAILLTNTRGRCLWTSVRRTQTVPMYELGLVLNTRILNKTCSLATLRLRQDALIG